jgi:predicted DCC family thiol-disulfide oxidoreductase YuxK
MTVQAPIWLVYDKECPVCDDYCRRVRINESIGELRLIDAREASEIMDEITAAGMDIDQGMVLKVNDVLYYGDDAMHALALMSSRSGFFNRLNYHMFRSKRLAKIFYPVLRTLRNLLLKLLRKTRINNLNIPGNDRF